MTAPAASVAAVQKALEAHSVAAFAGSDTACSCDRRWRTNQAWRDHIATAAADAAVEAATPGIQADALREAAVPIASALSNRLLNVGHPPETTGTVAALVQRALRDRADRIEAQP